MLHKLALEALECDRKILAQNYQNNLKLLRVIFNKLIGNQFVLPDNYDLPSGYSITLSCENMVFVLLYCNKILNPTIKLKSLDDFKFNYGGYDLTVGVLVHSKRTNEYKLVWCIINDLKTLGELIDNNCTAVSAEFKDRLYDVVHISSVLPYKENKK